MERPPRRNCGDSLHLRAHQRSRQKSRRRGKSRRRHLGKIRGALSRSPRRREARIPPDHRTLGHAGFLNHPETFLLRVPRQYKINPRKTEASVPPTSRSSKLHLFTVSPGGTSETKIPSRSEERRVGK